MGPVLLVLAGIGLVSSRIMLPNYAIMVALACVGGACTQDEQTTPPSHNNNNNKSQCFCPPTMHIEIDGTVGETSLCNNATFDWLVHTLLAQIAIEKEQVAEKTALIKQIRQQGLDNEKEVGYLAEEKQDLSDDNEKLREQNKQLLDELDEIRAEKGKALLRPMDCGDVQRFGYRYSGVYTIYPRGMEGGLEVFCDLNTDRGGWLVIQRREDGKEDFARDWAQYKKGFGQISKEFWLGNDNLHMLTQQRPYELRVDMTDYEGVSGHALYKTFAIDDESKAYRLHITGYSGDAGDAMSQHNKKRFSTYDVDNDYSKSGHCCQLFGEGAWWFYRCYDSNLNGRYGRNQDNKGVVWFQWNDDYTPQREVQMKIRPAGF